MHSTNDLPLLRKIKQWGFDVVEIARFDFGGFPARAIGQAIRDEGLVCGFCSALTGNLSLAGPEPQAAFDFLRRGVEVAAEIGAPVFSGPYCAPVGYLPGRRKTAGEWKQVVEYLQRLGPILDQHGVTIALEALNRFETYLLNTAAETVQLIDEVAHPRVGVLFDTFHANIEEKDVAAAVPLLGPRRAQSQTSTRPKTIAAYPARVMCRGPQSSTASGLSATTGGWSSKASVRRSLKSRLPRVSGATSHLIPTRSRSTASLSCGSWLQEGRPRAA